MRYRTFLARLAAWVLVALVVFAGYSAFGQSPEPSYQVAQGGMMPGPGTVHSAGGGTTPTLRQNNISADPTAGGGSATTIALAFGSTVASGSLIVGGVTFNSTGGANISSVSDDKSNTYTVFQNLNDASSAQRVALFYCPNVTNAPQTITVTLTITEDYKRLMISEFTNVAVSPLDGSNINLNAGSTSTDGQVSGTFTTAVNGDLIYNAFVDTTGGGPPWTPGTGFTSIDNSSGPTMPMGQSYSIQSTAGAGTQGTWTETVGSRNIVGAGAFKHI